MGKLRHVYPDSETESADQRNEGIGVPAIGEVSRHLTRAKTMQCWEGAVDRGRLPTFSAVNFNKK